MSLRLVGAASWPQEKVNICTKRKGGEKRENENESGKEREREMRRCEDVLVWICTDVNM